jgi:hypothetical protein
MVMATHMVKVAREGYVAKAVRTARPGETSGGSFIYEVVNVPDNVTIEQLIKAFEGWNAPTARFKLDYSEVARV